MAKQVMDRKASDNKYLHKDFHVTLDIGIDYIGKHYGEDAVKEYLIRFADAYYRPMSLSELEAYFLHIYAEEERPEVLQTSRENGVLTVEISECPAMSFMRSIGHEPSEWYKYTTSVLYAEIARICGMTFELVRFDEKTGAAILKFGGEDQ